MSDKYDEATAYLTKHPQEIYNIWNRPEASPHGCLFVQRGTASMECCPSQIKNHASPPSGITKDIYEGIRADEVIPYEGEDIVVDRLHRFAYWQRRMDDAGLRINESYANTSFHVVDSA